MATGSGRVDSPAAVSIGPKRLFGPRELCDLAGVVLPASFFSLVMIAKFGALVSFLGSYHDVVSLSTLLIFAASIGYRLLVICFFAIAVALFVIRTRPVRKAAGVLPRLLAVGGTFILTLLAFASPVPLSIVGTYIACLLLFAGDGIALLSLWTLGRSFSILPEARRLVTGGPYAIVRHPIYLGEIIAGCGMLLQVLSVQTAIVYLLFVALQMLRTAYEEEVLTQSFPEYKAYKAKTARLVPGIV